MGVVCDLVAGGGQSRLTGAQVAEVVQDEQRRLLVLGRHHELALHVEGVEQALDCEHPLPPAYQVDEAEAELQQLDLVDVVELELRVAHPHEEFEAVQKCLQAEGGVIGQDRQAAEPLARVEAHLLDTLVLQQGPVNSLVVS